MENSIYMYGMVLLTQSLLLSGDYPTPDTYSELTARYRLIGGETGTAAAVLCALGCHCRLAGNHLGSKVEEDIRAYFANKPADLSYMVSDPTFDGVEDLVIITKDARTCFGQFGGYFSEPIHRWQKPEKEHLAHCRTAGIDPFFMDESVEAARLCHEAGIPFVTIDCRPESPVHQMSAVNVVSNEYLTQQFGSADRRELLRHYAKTTSGLTIFTLGAGELLYLRPGQDIRTFAPYRVKVESTLGAGDSFKAGCIYALDRGMSDDALVPFASATAACALMRYPIAHNPPTLEGIRRVMEGE